MDIPTITADIEQLLAEKLAIDAAQDAALLATLNTKIAQLEADLADCRGDVDPPPVDPPPTTAFPDASNTGVPKGVVLRASGGLVITTPGIVEGLDISGGLAIKSKGVTVRKSRLTSSAFIPITCRGFPDFIMEDCEVIGTGTAGASGIDGCGTFRRLNVHGFENDFNITGGGGVKGGIYDSYLWGLKVNSGSPHYDTIQMDGGVSNFEIIHNTIINEFKQTSALMIDNYFGSIRDILVDKNRLVGGGFTIYVDGQFSGGTISGVKVTNNRMGKGAYDYILIRNNNAVFSGNIDDLTGKAI